MEDPKAFAARHFEQAAEEGLSIVERYATDPPLFFEALWDALGPMRGEDAICELGFGSGWLLDEMRSRFPGTSLTGLDISSQHIRQAQARVKAAGLVRGDMESLPFTAGAFSRVVTCWTLYFMNDIDRALAEARRVLRPGASFIAATVAPDHMKEFSELSRAVSREITGRDDWTNEVDHRFDTVTGAPYMRRHFKHVELKEWQGELVLPDVEMLVLFWEQFHPEQARGEDAPRFRDAVRRLGTAMRDRDGSIRIGRHDGLFAGFV